MNKIARVFQKKFEEDIGPFCGGSDAFVSFCSGILVLSESYPPFQNQVGSQSCVTLEGERKELKLFIRFNVQFSRLSLGRK